MNRLHISLFLRGNRVHISWGQKIRSSGKYLCCSSSKEPAGAMQCRPVPVATPRAPCIASSSTHEEFSQDRQRTTRCDPCDLVGRSRVLRATLPLGFGYVTTPLRPDQNKTKNRSGYWSRPEKHIHSCCFA